MFRAFNSKYGTKTCTLSTGQVVPEGRASDRYEHDVDHEWASALLAMDGGNMDQFDLIGLGTLTSGDNNGDLLTCPARSPLPISLTILLTLTTSRWV